jgi:hypothetical protein
VVRPRGLDLPRVGKWTVRVVAVGLGPLGGVGDLGGRLAPLPRPPLGMGLDMWFVVEQGVAVAVACRGARTLLSLRSDCRWISTVLCCCSDCCCVLLLFGKARRWSVRYQRVYTMEVV